MSNVISDSHELHPQPSEAVRRAELPIGLAVDPDSILHGRFRIVLGSGFARDTVAVRYGGVEVARRCGVTTRPDGIAGIVFTEVPVGAVDERLVVEVVGRLVSGSLDVAPPSTGEVTVEVHLDQLDVQVRL